MAIWAKVLLALTMIMEARGQSDLGKAMVAEVAMNRSRALAIERMPTAVEISLFQEGAFAVWAPDVYGPGFALRLAVLECTALGAFPDDPWCVERFLEARVPADWGPRFKIGTAEYWEGVWAIAVNVYDETWSPPPQLAGKKHFDNPIFWPDGLPEWMENCERVGDHVFCD